MVRAKWAVLGLAAILAASGTGMMAASIGPFDDTVEQPIAFPHDLHAGPTSQIPCMYCHSSADRSVDAGIPAVQVCAGCHAPVGAPIFRGDRPEIQKLAAYWREQRPIPWVRIYDLPDHAHFPHMRHVNAGVTCQECHGAVETMPVVTKEASLQMGWCVECHRQREVRTDCFVCHY
jgi:hypothetical protein